MWLIALIIGVFIGAILGVFAMALCFACGDYYPDRELEWYVDGVWRD